MKNLLLAIALLSTTTIFAQEDDFFSTGPIPPKPKNYAFFIGPRIGGDITTMTQPNECNLYDAAGIGFSGGVAMKLRLGAMSEDSDGGTGVFGIGLDLKYKQNNVKTIADDNLSLGYFEAPIMAQFYPFYKNTKMNSFYLEIGVDIAALLSKNPDLMTVQPNNERYDLVTYHISDLKGGDIRIPVGIGYTFPKGFDINMRYYLGTSDLAKNMACKMSSFELSVGWLFKVGK